MIEISICWRECYVAGRHLPCLFFNIPLPKVRPIWVWRLVGGVVANRSSRCAPSHLSFEFSHAHDFTVACSNYSIHFVRWAVYPRFCFVAFLRKKNSCALIQVCISFCLFPVPFLFRPLQYLPLTLTILPRHFRLVELWRPLYTLRLSLCTCLCFVGHSAYWQMANNMEVRDGLIIIPGDICHIQPQLNIESYRHSKHIFLALTRPFPTANLRYDAKIKKYMQKTRGVK